MKTDLTYVSEDETELKFAKIVKFKEAFLKLSGQSSVVVPFRGVARDSFWVGIIFTARYYYLPGALRKSSHSLSHLLVSSCYHWGPMRHIRRRTRRTHRTAVMPA